MAGRSRLRPRLPRGERVAPIDVILPPIRIDPIERPRPIRVPRSPRRPGRGRYRGVEPQPTPPYRRPGGGRREEPRIGIPEDSPNFRRWQARQRRSRVRVPREVRPPMPEKPVQIITARRAVLGRDGVLRIFLGGN